MAPRSGVTALLLLLAPRALGAPAGLQARFEAILANTSKKYNCSFSIAYRDAKDLVTAADGVVDFSTNRTALPSDAYAFGSVTKVLTGASILRLVSQGAFGLDDKVAPLVDPFLAAMADKDPTQTFRSMGDLWGAQNVSNTTIRQLLGMQSAVPDFDTANPCYGGRPGCVPTDSLRASLYADPTHSWSPTKLMEVDWVKNHWKGECGRSFLPDSMRFCYSSTNFMLLGMILAAHSKDGSWTDLQQAEYLPEYLKDQLQFAVSGAPKVYTHVHGYDRTSYNLPKGQTNDHDNWEVSGVFSGWTASDVVASAAAIANLTYEVYGPNYAVAPKAFADLMIPSARGMYGLATFNLNHNTGQTGTYGTAYGHLGATYGYQSVTAYFPAIQASMTVATNIETDFQAQPGEAMCFAYNAAVSLIVGKEINCTYGQGSFYSGGCKCDPVPTEEVVTAYV